MFVVDCHTCGGPHLISVSQIDIIRNTEHGIFVHFTCGCGARWLHVTGRRARQLGVLWERDLTADLAAA